MRDERKAVMASEMVSKDEGSIVEDGIFAVVCVCLREKKFAIYVESFCGVMRFGPWGNEGYI